jgi:hypothetical protein
MSSKTSSNSTVTREEKRKAQARANKLYQDEKTRKRKEWLANHPEVAAQEAREKEERRLNHATIRMLGTMKEKEPEKKKNKKKPVNAFAAFYSDSEEEEEEEEEIKTPESKEVMKENQIVFNAGARFDWADEE